MQLLQSAEACSSTKRKPARGRTFQASWKDLFPWKEYDSVSVVLWCKYCEWGLETGKATPLNRQKLEGICKCWVTGFNQWHKGKSECEKHNCRPYHLECAQLYVAAKADGSTNHTNAIMEKIKNKAVEEKWANYKALVSILDAVLFLCSQGLALRGHDADWSNFYQIIRLLSHHSAHVDRWLNRPEKYKWLSHDIQNEMISLCSNAKLLNFWY